MARLIDADKLKAHYSWWEGGGREMTLDEAKRDFDTIIDLQPTVEPKHGMTKGEYATLVGLHTYSPAYDKDAPLDEDFVKTVEGIRRIVLEPKHGRWIDKEVTVEVQELLGCRYDARVFACSHCGNVKQSRSNYCSRCGAKMDEGRAYTFEVGETYSAAEGEG